jgi:hypothetical protein
MDKSKNLVIPNVQQDYFPLGYKTSYGRLATKPRRTCEIKKKNDFIQPTEEKCLPNICTADFSLYYRKSTQHVQRVLLALTWNPIVISAEDYVFRVVSWASSPNRSFRKTNNASSHTLHISLSLI